MSKITIDNYPREGKVTVVEVDRDEVQGLFNGAGHGRRGRKKVA